MCGDLTDLGSFAVLGVVGLTVVSFRDLRVISTAEALLN